MCLPTNPAGLPEYRSLMNVGLGPLQLQRTEPQSCRAPILLTPGGQCSGSRIHDSFRVGGGQMAGHRA